MKIRATRTFLNDIGMVRRGAEIDIRDVDARSLIRRRIAVAAGDGEQSEDQPKPTRKPAAKPARGAAAPKQGE